MSDLSMRDIHKKKKKNKTLALIYQVHIGCLRHHLQTRPGPGPRPSKNRTLILWTPEKAEHSPEL